MSQIAEVLASTAFEDNIELTIRQIECEQLLPPVALSALLMFIPAVQMLDDACCSAAVALQPLEGPLDCNGECPILLYESDLNLDGSAVSGSIRMKPRQIGQLPTCKDAMPEGMAREVPSGFLDCKALSPACRHDPTRVGCRVEQASGGSL